MHHGMYGAKIRYRDRRSRRSPPGDHTCLQQRRRLHPFRFGSSVKNFLERFGRKRLETNAIPTCGTTLHATRERELGGKAALRLRELFRAGILDSALRVGASA